MKLKDKKITVIGMGVTGTAAANFLANREARVTLTDQKKREDLTQALHSLDPKVSTLFETSTPPADAELIVLSPGMDIQSPFLEEARRRGTEIISEIELAYRFNKVPIIAIAGTNGKTTTTTLIGNLLETAGKKIRTGGNIGIPFISLIDEDSEDFMVLEISSFQLEAISRFRPRIALVLNITPDHLDRHKTMQHYAALKRNITVNQGAEDFLILNADDPYALELGRATAARKLYFSVKKTIEQGACLRDGIIRVRIDGIEQEICPADRLNQVMQWQVENALAAATVGALVGVDAKTIAESIQTFSGLEHRLEWVRTVRGIDFVNNSKGTNVGSVQKSLESFQRPIILIIGGQDKGGDFSPLRPLFKTKVKHLVLLGEAKSKIKKVLNGSTSYEEADTLESAFNQAVAQAGPGDVVLLSPACASFDMFRDYADRGNQFKAMVNRLS